ncbi:MAG: DUF1592 domain-containing protein [Rubripirellula sp.]|nr:DUF1592 domain-containing protein [Rubripirellula sp.]
MKLITSAIQRFPLLCIAMIIVTSISAKHEKAIGQDTQNNLRSENHEPFDDIGFLKNFCFDCHSGEQPSSAVNLPMILESGINRTSISTWIRIHDQIVNEQMPPRDGDQPSRIEREAMIAKLAQKILSFEQLERLQSSQLRRLTRLEYENTVRDLFNMPGIDLADKLPADGEAYGFDKTFEALDVSHVNIAKYLEAADHILEMAIATRPIPPTIQKRRISLVNRGGFVAHIVMNGDGVLLKNGQPDPDFPPAGEQNHLNQGAHERWGSFRNGASVGLFRHEDESVSPYFIEHVTIYPGQYRVRTSLWSFQWDCGNVMRGRGTEAARLSVVKLTGDGRGGQHPSDVLGYFDAPADQPMQHEVNVWLNHNELIGFNTASLAPAANYYKKKRALEFTGPGIVVDWLDIEGPLYETWPPKSHQRLFGTLPIIEFRPTPKQFLRPPTRERPRQLGAGMNRPDPEPGIWSVHSESPLLDAKRLLADFLPRLFRRPVPDTVVEQYVNIVRQRLETGDCFETSMRHAYRNALVSPDFLYHLVDNEPEQSTNALACQLAYFLWNSAPDDRLRKLGQNRSLENKENLKSEVARLLSDRRSDRFIQDFIGQWLKLNDIAATDPDHKIYPEFSPYLQDSMVAETRAFFRELVLRDRSVTNLIQSNFLILNQKLASHYGIKNVTGTELREVPLPEDCPRGGFLTQGSILKITANGTTTSPVPRGAFVLERLLGTPPLPPPANISAIEPDVRGTTTVRAQLERHRKDTSCAICHRQIDPPGFALESFDVIGGYRDRYRSIGEGDQAERGNIDPMIGISFRLGKEVETHGELKDGESFNDITDYQKIVASDVNLLTQNLAKQLLTYATGRPIRFSERAELEKIVTQTIARGAGVRTLIEEIIQSPLFFQPKQDQKSFETKKTSHPIVAGEALPPRDSDTTSDDVSNRVPDAKNRFMMTETLESIEHPVRIETITTTDPSDLQRQRKMTFKEEDQMTVRVLGLFIKEQSDSFNKALQRIDELRLVAINFEKAEATIQYADSLASGTTSEITERLNQRVRQHTSGIFSIQTLGKIPHDQFEKAEIEIVGLDCKACSLAVHDLIVSIDGVTHATADFESGKAYAWFDASKCSAATIKDRLTESGVTLRAEDRGETNPSE